MDEKQILDNKHARGSAQEIAVIAREEEDGIQPSARGRYWDVLFEELKKHFPQHKLRKDGPEVAPFSDAGAEAFGRQEMPFGKHKGERIDDVPMDYLEWFASQTDSFKRDLNRYLLSKRVSRES